jgi:predicted outer membrane repeat protein
MKNQVRYSHFLSILLRAGLIVALLVALLPSAALAYPGTQDVYYVVALDDGAGMFHDYWTADGWCDFSNIYSDDQCSLVAAIEQANARGGRQEIYFRPGLEPGWVPLAGFTNLPNPFYVTSNGSSTDLPTITGDVIIDGNLAYSGGPGGVMVFDGSSARPIFEVANGATLTLRNMTIRNGSNSGDGGCVVASGNVVLENVTVQGCTSGGSQGGGAIYTSGSFSETDSTLQNSQATAGHGGAVYAGTDVTLNGGSFQNNWANGNGGAVYVGGNLTTLNGPVFGTVTGNTSNHDALGAGEHGGAVYVAGSATLGTALGGGGTFSNNLADCPDNTCFGGGIYVGDTLTAYGFTFSDNRARGSGGGAYVVSTADLTNGTHTTSVP